MLPVNTHTTTCRDRSSASRRLGGLACALSVLLSTGGGFALAQSGSAPKFSEYEVKAAFLFNFMQFVEWPAGASTNAKAPFMIGVLGEDPFGAMLEKTVKSETLRGRPLAIRRTQRIANLKDCHVVFVCRSEKARIGEILDALHGSSVLTVSDIEHFCRNGGMIGLFNEGGKIRFEINQEAAEQCQLKISSKLLRLGRQAER